ncbi:MAG: xanthine phosphoribosyltransferase [Alphaproteobacteria bacterium]|nr:xanthine phosphoribosyltransferase [Alphaproteobacteria bacterium]
MSDYTEKTSITWEEIKIDSMALAKKLREDSNNTLPDKILAVTRGGMIPAALVTRILGIKQIETIGLESYSGQNQKEAISMLKQANPSFLENTLIIDDLVDTGKTFEFLRPLTKNCIFATLYAKPDGEPHTDYFVRSFEQETWVDFPWEV